MNIDQIIYISAPDEQDKIYMDLFGNEGRYWFEGIEAAEIVNFFNRTTLLDTTKSPGEAPL